MEAYNHCIARNLSNFCIRQGCGITKRNDFFTKTVYSFDINLRVVLTMLGRCRGRRGPRQELLRMERLAETETRGDFGLPDGDSVKKVDISVNHVVIVWRKSRTFAVSKNEGQPHRRTSGRTGRPLRGGDEARFNSAMTRKGRMKFKNK